MEEQPKDNARPEPTSSPEVKKAKTQIEEGRLCYRQGQFEQALAHFKAAYEQYAAAGEKSLQAEVANDIGVVHTVLQHWQEADKYLNQAHQIFTDLEDLSGEAQTLGNLGSMFRARGDLKQAAANLQLASDRFHLVGDNERRAATLKVLSMVRLSQFRILQALAAYDAALACNPKPSGLQKFLRWIISLPLRLLSH